MKKEFFKHNWALIVIVVLFGYFIIRDFSIVALLLFIVLAIVVVKRYIDFDLEKVKLNEWFLELSVIDKAEVKKRFEK